jgi:hypothetical protein
MEPFNKNNRIKEIVIQGYGTWVTRRIMNRWRPYIITIMFEELNGNKGSAWRQMEKCVERTYAKALTRIIREPRKLEISKLPMWIVCPDYPVPKHDKSSLIEVQRNQGIHIGGIALIPPWSRLKEGLDVHFLRHQGLYTTGGVARVHATPVTKTPLAAVDYSFKAIRRRRSHLDDILVLPRCHSEMQ